MVIDKPLAASVADAELLLETSRKSGKLLSVFQSRRWDNDLLTVRQLIAADLLGPITRFESHFDRYLAAPKPGAWRELGAPEEAGGLLFDLGAHLIDQALLLFGQPVSVYAEVEKRRPGVQVDDDTFVALHFANGVRAHLRSDTDACLKSDDDARSHARTKGKTHCTAFASGSFSFELSIGGGARSYL